MDKRGDLPVTILIIGVFVVCTLALFSFIYSSYLINKSFVGVEVIENANIQIETHNLQHFYVEKNATKISPGWNLNWIKEKTIFSVEYNS